MLRNTLSKKSSHSFAKRATPVAVLAASIALVGCSGSAVADVTTDGQAAYICALTDHVLEEHGTPKSWEVFIGDDANPGMRETAAIGLLAQGFDNETFASTGTSLIEGVSRIDVEGLTSNLHKIQAACDDSGVNPAGDVSHEGQLDYACTLTRHFTEEHGAAAEWMDDHEQGAWDQVAELSGATALVGAANAQVLAEYPELSEAGSDVLRMVQRQRPDDVDNSLEAFQAACAAGEVS